MNHQRVLSALLAIAFLVVGCRPETGRSPVATPALQAMPQPRPTLASGTPYRHYGLLVTPLPDEKVRLGEVTEVASFAAPMPSRYSIRNDYVTVGTNQEFVLYVRDAQAGKDIRLGYDGGHAEFGAMSDEYVIWKYLCDECIELKSGLYAYSLKTGANTLITNDRLKNYPKIAGHWVIYSERPPGSDFIANLYAYNLDTSEEILVTDKLGLLLASPGDYYALDGQRIVWLGVNPEGGMRVYDLTTRTVQTPVVPELFAPIKLNIHGDIVIWNRTFA
jgi:hypothetical protein